MTWKPSNESSAVQSVRCGRRYRHRHYLIAGGGKRIRPMLLLLSSKALGSSARAVFGSAPWSRCCTPPPSSTTTSSTRRPRAAAARRPTLPGAIRSASSPATGSTCRPSSALEERNFHVLDLLISLTQQMVEGELLQMQKLGHLINEEEYFDLIFRKTACLFKVSMQLGAAIGASDRSAKAAGRVRPQPRPRLPDRRRRA